MLVTEQDREMARREPDSAKKTTESCYNCGLAYVTVRAKITLKAKNDFQRESRRTLSFCSEECANQTAFLQLRTASTPTAITRYLGSTPIRYADFRSQVKLGVEPILGEGLNVRKPIAESRINTGASEGKNEHMALPHIDLVSVRSRRLGGRPRKWKSEADRLRAYRARGGFSNYRLQDCSQVSIPETEARGTT